nr:FAD-dependent oxidoreductase [Demequina sp. NBRC 110056]
MAGVEAPSFPPLTEDVSADLVIVGAGYSGLWTAILAKERDPHRSVVVLEGARIGWAASGRNGGFCEPSLTHGHENGLARWPDEIATLEAMGRANLDEIESTVERYGMDAHFERTGSLTVAVEPHQLAWLGEGALDAAQVRTRVDSPTYLGGELDPDSALVHPYRLAVELARVATELGVVIHERTPVERIGAHEVIARPRHAPGGATRRGRPRPVAPAPGAGGSPAGQPLTERSGAARSSTARSETSRSGSGAASTVTVRAGRIALATNAFRSLLRRNALMTVPVYDYVLMTEPLTDAQLASVGWEGREGVGDMANQFHYYRLTRDNRILFGGYDAIYHAGGRVRRAHEDRPASYERLAAHFLTTFPQLTGIRFAHRWAGAIDTCTRFSAFFGTAHGGSVAYALGYTGLGVGATRFGANVMLDLLDGVDSPRTRLAMVRERPTPFPPEPLASAAINLTRRSLDRADHREGRRDPFLRTLDRFGLGFDS